MLQQLVPPVPPSRDNMLKNAGKLSWRKTLANKLQQLVPPSRDNTRITGKLSWRKTLANTLQRPVPPVPPSRDNTLNR
jgi:hypothetical protein